MSTANVMTAAVLDAHNTRSCGYRSPVQNRGPAKFSFGSWPAVSIRLTPKSMRAKRLTLAIHCPRYWGSTWRGLSRRSAPMSADSEGVAKFMA